MEKTITINESEAMDCIIALQEMYFKNKDKYPHYAEAIWELSERMSNQRKR
jgi:hypothetical protein